MSRVYESLKKGMHDTLQHGKVTPITTARAKSSESRLKDGVEAIEKLVLDRLSTLKTAVTDSEAAAEAEMQDAVKSIAKLNDNVAAMDAKIRELEDTLRKKDLATKGKEENLLSKIHQLEGELKKTAEVLSNRDLEVNNLKSTIDPKSKRVIELESAITEVNKKATVLEERANKKDSTIQALQEDYRVKLEGLERELGSKDNLLAERDKQIIDLQSQLKAVTNGIREMSSFFKQTEALVTVETKNDDADLTRKKLMSVEELPSTAPSQNQVGTSGKIIRQTVAPLFFERFIDELTQSIGPMAALIVSDHVVALGGSLERFPQDRTAELLDMVSREIVDDSEKTRFRNRISRFL